MPGDNNKQGAAIFFLYCSHAMDVNMYVQTLILSQISKKYESLSFKA